MMTLFSITYLICLTICHMCLAANLTDVEKLYSDKMTNYNKYVRPLESHSSPVIVNASFNLIGIKEFDEVNGKFALTGFFIVQWKDIRLSWNPYFYNWLFFTELPESKVWTPDITLANPYDTISNIANGFLPVTVLYDGKATWMPGDVISSSCSVDVTYYPFDTQLCNMLMICWGMGPTSIVLQAPDPEIGLTYFTEHGTWELLQSNVSTHLTKTLSYISINMKMKRRPAFFVINIVLPMVFMVILNLLVFILPVESGERVSYAITVLLAIAVFLTLVGDNLPKTSKPMSILSYFLLTDLILSALICFIVIFGLQIHFRDDNKSAVPKWLSKTLQKCCCLQEKASSETVVKPFNDLDKSEKIGIFKSLSHSTEKNLDIEEVRVTWKMVSNFYDKVMFTLFMVCIIALTFCYFAVTAWRIN